MLVHSHVEGGVGAVGEAPRGRVQLVGADAEVEQHAGHRSEALGRHQPGQLVEPGAADDGPPAVASQPVCGGRDRISVLVDAEQPPAGLRVEQPASVPRATDGGVDQEAVGHRAEQGDHPAGQHRHVREALAHPQPLDRLDAVGLRPRSSKAEAGGEEVFHLADRGAAHTPRLP